MTLVAKADSASGRHRLATSKTTGPATMLLGSSPATESQRSEPASPRIDRLLFQQGYCDTQDLLRVGFESLKSTSRQEIFAVLRKSAQERPLSYAAGVEALLVKVETLLTQSQEVAP